MRWLLCFLLGCSGAAEPELTRSPSQGPMIGVMSSEGGQSWLGIPFAQATSGAYRWTAPRPWPTWTEPREMDEMGEMCAQLAGIASKTIPLVHGDVVGSEDCLTLNIFAPPDTVSTDKKPVMVWIHGGGNAIGTANAFDGQYLAARGDVIVVAINYRLGPFGWLSLPALRETAASPEDASGNFGTLDQIAALRWIQENISAFGGDSDRVTVFGESAGGRNVLGLMTSPLAEGLFHRAIAQSALAYHVSPERAEGRSEGSGPQAKNNSSLFLSRLPEGDALQTLEPKAQMEALRDLSVEELLMSYPEEPMGMFRFPQMFRDGVVLPTASLHEALQDPSLPSVPLITGTNRDESKLFMMLNPALVTRDGITIVPKDPEAFERRNRYGSAVWRLQAVDEVASSLVRGGASEVWTYAFEWDEEPVTAFGDLSQLLGAAHAIEVPFVFGDFKGGVSLPFLFDEDSEPGRRTLSTQMMDLWAGFAREGAPPEVGGVTWPKWSADSPSTLVLDSPGDQGLSIRRGQLTLEEISQWLQAETEFTQEEKCESYFAMFRNTDLWDETAYTNLFGEGCSPKAPSPKLVSTRCHLTPRPEGCPEPPSVKAQAQDEATAGSAVDSPEMTDDAKGVGY